MGAKRLGGKRPGGKQLGGETTRGGNGLRAKQPGFTDTWILKRLNLSIYGFICFSNLLVLEN